LARPLRLEHPGAIWHITSRGNEKREIFREAADRVDMLGLLGETVARYRWALHAYVFMSNHYHLLLETPEATLSRGMHYLNSVYTQRLNRKYGRVGHLFQGRFHGVLIEREGHLLEVARYVVLNPVRAGLVDSPEDWRWSNYRATAGLAPAPAWLQVDWTLSQFGGHRGDSTRAYRGFVAEGRATGQRPWDRVENQIFLGSERFRKQMQARTSRVPLPDEIPHRQAFVGRPSLLWIVESAQRVTGCNSGDGNAVAVRAMIAYLAREDAGSPLALVGAALNVKASMASRLARRGAKLMSESRSFRTGVAQVRELWLRAQVRVSSEYRIKA
jgi:putative transposase